MLEFDDFCQIYESRDRLGPDLWQARITARLAQEQTHLKIIHAEYFETLLIAHFCGHYQSAFFELFLI